MGRRNSASALRGSVLKAPPNLPPTPPCPSLNLGSGEPRGGPHSPADSAGVGAAPGRTAAPWDLPRMAAGSRWQEEETCGRGISSASAGASAFISSAAVTKMEAFWESRAGLWAGGPAPGQFYRIPPTPGSVVDPAPALHGGPITRTQ